jgi:hypothetical protein
VAIPGQTARGDGPTYPRPKTLSFMTAPHGCNELTGELTRVRRLGRVSTDYSIEGIFDARVPAQHGPDGLPSGSRTSQSRSSGR